MEDVQLFVKCKTEHKEGASEWVREKKFSFIMQIEFAQREKKRKLMKDWRGKSFPLKQGEERKKINLQKFTLLVSERANKRAIQEKFIVNLLN